MLDVTLLLGCLSLGIEPALMLAIVDQESSGDPIALNVNRWDGDQVVPESASDAAEAAGMFRDAGYTVDLGLAGINSRNLERLDVSFIDALDPCTSIALGETIFMEGLETARAAGKLGDDTLRAALSLYNTGSITRGFENGYVGQVWARYVASDAYLGRVGSSRVKWTAAGDKDEPKMPIERSPVTRSSSVVSWVSRNNDATRKTVINK